MAILSSLQVSFGKKLTIPFSIGQGAEGIELGMKIKAEGKFLDHGVSSDCPWLPN
jgi:hypothetical protein